MISLVLYEPHRVGWQQVLDMLLEDSLHIFKRLLRRLVYVRSAVDRSDKVSHLLGCPRIQLKFFSQLHFPDLGLRVQVQSSRTVCRVV